MLKQLWMAGIVLFLTLAPGRADHSSSLLQPSDSGAVVRQDEFPSYKLRRDRVVRIDNVELKSEKWEGEDFKGVTIRVFGDDGQVHVFIHADRMTFRYLAKEKKLRLCFTNLVQVEPDGTRRKMEARVMEMQRSFDFSRDSLP